MIFIFILSYLGGLLTIFAPCVLPVIPFIFARSDRPFKQTGLPILLGMAVTFSILASITAIGGAWLIQIYQYGRYVALLLILLLGLTLLSPTLSDLFMSPFVRLGDRLQKKAEQNDTIKGSFLLGVSVGFLWAPCAGPILGLVLTSAALNGANLISTLLLLVFAAGAATSLGIALLAGSHILNRLKRHIGLEEWIRRGLGITVLIGVLIISFGWDTRFLSQWTFLNTTNTEYTLIKYFNTMTLQSNTKKIKEGTIMPYLTGASLWLNSTPLTTEMLQGKVILIDFWTYSCINCLRTLPYLKAWNAKYKNQGLVIIGVHTPEFAFEQNPHNVEKALHDLAITYPIAIDNQYKIWNAFHNQYWPAHYLIDTNGIIRYHHFGEGDYEETERQIQTLLKETSIGTSIKSNQFVKIKESGITAATNTAFTSPETYIGYERQQNFASPQPIQKNSIAEYHFPKTLSLNQWGLNGVWIINSESAMLQTTPGKISYHFIGRDLHLVLGSAHGKPIRFKVTLDGATPGIDHGLDIDANGNGIIQEQRLYQLIRQNGKTSDRTFQIEFLDPGAIAFAFTFG